MTTTAGEPKRDFRVRLLPLGAVAERGDAVRLDVAELHMEVQLCVPGEVTVTVERRARGSALENLRQARHRSPRNSAICSSNKKPGLLTSSGFAMDLRTRLVHVTSAVSYIQICPVGSQEKGGVTCRRASLSP